MREKVGNRCLIDKNPGLTGAIPVLLRLLPQTRILYALRDPRDVALSGYFRWLNLQPSTVSYLSLEGACQRTAAELDFWHQLREIIPPNLWKETRYEETVVNPQQETQRILSWMNLEWEDGINDYRKHLQTRGVNSPTYEAVSKPVYKSAVNRWQHYEKHFENATNTLEESLSQFHYA